MPLSTEADVAIRKQIWSGSIPFSLSLSERENLTQDTPPYYCVLPRHSYLYLELDNIKDYFGVKDATETWFENGNGQPVKWQYPIGVLFDLYAVNNICHLTVHFRNFPENRLIRFSSRDDVKKMYLNSLKEATFVKRGDVKPINDFSLSEVSDIWLGFVESDYSKHWKVNEKLYEITDSIPVRVFNGLTHILSQYSIPKLKEDGTSNTIGDFLVNEYSDLISKKDDDRIDLKSKVIIQGIEPPLQAPLSWLSCNMSYPDNFLYIVLMPH